MKMSVTSVLTDYISVTLLLGILGCTGYMVLSRLLQKTPKNLPPGPKGWRKTLQLVKASMNSTLHELITQWAKQYGPILFLYNFSRPMVFINSVAIARQLWGSEEYKHIFSDRATLYVSKTAWYNKDIIFVNYDGPLRKKRRMFHKLLGFYGDGVEKFENVVNQEMDRLINELHSQKEGDIDLPKVLSRSLKVILYVLNQGELPEDITYPDILENYDIAVNKLMNPSMDLILTIFPVVGRIPGPYKEVVDNVFKCKAAAEEIMCFQPKRTYVPENPRGIADHLFELQEKSENKWMKDDPEHVTAFLTSVYVAAHLTSRSSILSTFLCLLNYPTALDRVQAEIDQVIGERKPKIGDRLSMPYTEAVILESLRLVSSIPLMGYRISNQDTEINGMTIPKDTVCVINLWFSHHDETIWEDPWSFKPERFLDSHGQLLQADHPVRKNQLSFGVGLRACPGEVFAKTRTFLFITNVLQKFKLLPPANEKLVPADFSGNSPEMKGFIRQPPAYTCRLQLR